MRIIICLFAAALLGGCMTTAQRSDTPFTIAVRGEPPMCALALDRPDDPVLQTAAQELRAYVNRLTDSTLSDATDAARRIVLSVRADHGSDLEAESFALKLSPDHHTLTIEGGSSRACLYGVYELLERFGGVRFYTSWCERVPVLDRLEIPTTAWVDRREVPAFIMRQPLWYDVSAHPDFAAKLRVNGFNYAPAPNPATLGGEPYRFGGGLKSCHTFQKLCDPAVYFDEHPEYFSFKDGQRLKDRTQLCLSNPAVLEVVTTNLFERIRADPDARFYGVSQNDWFNYCECPTCAAIDAEEESHAGTLVRFINALAERVEREFPGKIVETLAYQYTRKPPKLTRLRANVMPCLCTIELDFARPIPESPFPENRAFREDISGWGRQTEQLYIWDYVTQFRHYPHGFANIGALQGNIRFFRDNGVRMLFEQGAREGHHAGFAELKAWLLARWMWNPELDANALLDDFFDGYYGPAAPHVRAYFDELHRRQQRVSSDPAHPLRVFDSVDQPPYDDDDFVLWCDGQWMKAENAVAGREPFAYNVRMGRFSLLYTRLERLRLSHTDEELAKDPEAVFLARRLLHEKEHARGPMQVVEWNEQPTIDAWRKIAAGSE